HVGSLKFEQRRPCMPPHTSPEEKTAHSQACCNSYVSSERDEGRWIWGGSPVLENSRRLLRRRLPLLRSESQVNIRLHTTVREISKNTTNGAPRRLTISCRGSSIPRTTPRFKGPLRRKIMLIPAVRSLLIAGLLALPVMAADNAKRKDSPDVPTRHN